MVFQILHIISRMVVDRGPFSVMRSVVYPEMTMWYLQCLVYWRLFVYLVPPKILNHKKEVILCSFLVCIISGFLPVGREFSIQRALCFSPFFFLGYYSFDIDLKNEIKKINILLTIFTFIVVFGVTYIWFNKDIGMILSGATPYVSHESINFLILKGRCCFIILAILLSLSFMRIIPESKKLSEWGKTTLFVYMYHLFFEAVLKIVVHKGYLPSGIFPLFLYSVILMLFLIWCSKFKLLSITLNPISYFIEKKKSYKYE